MESRSLDDLRKKLEGGSCDGVFKELYGQSMPRLKRQTRRYLGLLDRFEELFGEREAVFFSTPGRTEIGGNHTDHNGGHILAAAVDLDVLALAAKRADTIEIHSEGFAALTMHHEDGAKRAEEQYTSASIVRGVCARFRQLGYKTGGFCAVITSDVPKGSGLSSSAAFEVQVGTILNHFYNGGKISPLTIAAIAQYAENEYFNKPCGLMDMCACAMGGIVMIDFLNADAPDVKRLAFDLAKSGYTMVIVNTGGSHAAMTAEYAFVEAEMKAVAGALGVQALAKTDKETLFKNLKAVREKTQDRAILRAIHFFDDDKRVLAQVKALEEGNLHFFLSSVNASGLSSWTLCQNCYSTLSAKEQGIPIALEIARELLRESGAYRVHGGGFAGTIQAFVPDRLLRQFTTRMEDVFGTGSVFPASIRACGSKPLSL